jgi:cytoskeleton protein RodZ
MAASFGEQLRLAREARGVSLREISEQTRISMRYLEAIETDEYKRLPGGIFNRSFIKAYAKYIGYDEKAALEGYARTAREHGDAPDDAPLTSNRPLVYTDGTSTRSPIITLLLTVLILAVLSLVVYAGMHWYQRRELNRSSNPSATTSAPKTQPVTPNAAPAVAPTTPSAPVAAGLTVQIKAKGDKVWIRTRTDDGDSAQKTLEPDETKEFKPAQSLSIQYAPVKAAALEVTINGRVARLPADTKGNRSLAEMVITKDDYAQFLQ